MNRTAFTRTLAAAAVVAVSFGGMGFAHAAGEPSPSPTPAAVIEVDQLPVESFNDVVQKSNAYTAALNAAPEVHRSFDAYTAVVNVKRGPTGKETNLRGPGPLPVESVAAIKAATAFAPKYFALPAADAAAGKLVAALDVLVPLVGRAEEYYGGKRFKEDNLKLGRELHGQLVPEFERFFAAETALRAAVAELRPRIERRQMAVGEQARGRDLGWHVRGFLAATKPIVEMIPASMPPPPRPLMDPKLYATRLAELEAANTALAAYADAHPPEVAALPEGAALRADLAAMLAAARQLRPALEAKKLDRAVIGKRINDLINRYNAVVKRVNAAALGAG